MKRLLALALSMFVIGLAVGQEKKPLLPATDARAGWLLCIE